MLTIPVCIWVRQEERSALYKTAFLLSSAPPCGLVKIQDVAITHRAGARNRDPPQRPKRPPPFCPDLPGPIRSLPRRAVPPPCARLEPLGPDVGVPNRQRGHGPTEPRRRRRRRPSILQPSGIRLAARGGPRATRSAHPASRASRWPSPSSTGTSPWSASCSRGRGPTRTRTTPGPWRTTGRAGTRSTGP